MIVYLVTRYEFDGLENREPVVTRIVGAAASRAEAEDWISLATRDVKRYKGYDGRSYPRFGISEVGDLGSHVGPPIYTGHLPNETFS